MCSGGKHMSFERLLKPRTIAIFGGVQAGRKGDVRYIFTYKNRCDIDPICHVKPAQMRLAHCIISS